MVESIDFSPEIKATGKFEIDEYSSLLLDQMKETLLVPPNTDLSIVQYQEHIRPYCPFVTDEEDIEAINREAETLKEYNGYEILVWCCIMSRVAAKEISFSIENKVEGVKGPHLLSELVERKLRSGEEFRTDDSRIEWITSRLLSSHRKDLTSIQNKIPEGKILLIDSAMVEILCKHINEDILDALLNDHTQQETTELTKKTDYCISILMRRKISNEELMSGQNSNIYTTILKTFLKIPEDKRMSELFPNKSSFMQDLLIYSDDLKSKLVRKPLMEVAKFLATNSKYVHQDRLTFVDAPNLIGLIEDQIKLNQWPKCKFLLLRLVARLLERSLHRTLQTNQTGFF
jgi:hypothetical protein